MCLLIMVEVWYCDLAVFMCFIEYLSSWKNVFINLLNKNWNLESKM